MKWVLWACVMNCSLGFWTKMKVLFVCMLLLINKVSLQEIEATVGDAAILPCSNRNETPRDNVNVFWRFRDSKTVYDIINSRTPFTEQDPSFKDRVESFPDKWANGNFSIKLSNVKKTDEGLYICFITAIHINPITLRVKDPSTCILLPSNRCIKIRPQKLLLFPATLLKLALLLV